MCANLYRWLLIFFLPNYVVQLSKRGLVQLNISFVNIYQWNVRLRQFLETKSFMTHDLMYKIQAKNIYVTVKCLSVKHDCIFRFVLYSSTGKQTNKKKNNFPHIISSPVSTYFYCYC